MLPQVNKARGCMPKGPGNFKIFDFPLQIEGRIFVFQRVQNNFAELS